MPEHTIEALLAEGRRFDPPAAFTAAATVRDRSLYEEASRDPAAFWDRIARDLHWFEPWTQVLEWTAPYARWFVGGRTNLSYNCLDRHVAGGRRTKAAIIWEGEPGDERVLTYGDLHREVGRFANVLKGLGVRRGDRVSQSGGRTRLGSGSCGRRRG